MKEIKFGKKLEKIDPKRLIDQKKKNDDVENFFLVLGTFYNDLKNLTFHLIQTGNTLEKYDKVVCPEGGEYGGIKNHLHRLTVGHVHEFFEFLSVIKPLCTGSAENTKNIEC